MPFFDSENVMNSVTVMTEYLKNYEEELVIESRLKIIEITKNHKI